MLQSVNPLSFPSLFSAQDPQVAEVRVSIRKAGLQGYKMPGGGLHAEMHRLTGPQ